MSSSDLESFSSDRAFPASNENGPQSTPTDYKSSEGTRRLMAFACLAALFAAAISSVAGEVIMNRYKSDLFPPSKPYFPALEDMVRSRRARLYTALLTFTTTGGLLGLALGLAGGLARRYCIDPRVDFLQGVRPTIGLARDAVTHPRRDLGEHRGR
jgi:hypothetical protein